jgi:hypothetical protein
MRKLIVSTFASRAYVPAGDIPLGSFQHPNPSAKELARRQNLARACQ